LSQINEVIAKAQERKDKEKELTKKFKVYEGRFIREMHKIL